MKWIITGGSGFIGTNLCIALKKRNENILIIDLKRPKIDVPEYIKLDIRNKFIDKYIDEDDIIVHLAANVDANLSIEDPVFDAQENIIGTLNVLESVKNKRCKLIYASSAAVYGAPHHTPINEDHPTEPISPYGLSKLTGERYCLMYHKLYGIDVCALRFFNVYGRYQDPNGPYSGVITKFMMGLKKREPLIIYGDGEQTRDFVHVNDVINSVILASQKPVTGKVINIGSGTAVSIKTLAWLMFELAGIETGVEYKKPLKGDIRNSLADVARAGKLLGYSPSISLRAGLGLTWKWYNEKG